MVALAFAALWRRLLSDGAPLGAIRAIVIRSSIIVSINIIITITMTIIIISIIIIIIISSSSCSSIIIIVIVIMRVRARAYSVRSTCDGTVAHYLN